MTENHILVKTSEQSSLEQVLGDLANLYSDTEYVEGIQLFRKKGKVNSFLVLFSNSPDLDRFSYFINYLEFPINFPDFSPLIRGFYKTSDINQVPKLKKGNWLMFYINKDDKEADNVYIVNENDETYIKSFSGYMKELDNPIHDFKSFDVNLNDYHHIIDIYPAHSNEIKEVKPWWRFW